MSNVSTPKTQQAPKSEATDSSSAIDFSIIERRAFVLLSGGLDSTTCLHKAIVDHSMDSREDTLKRIQRNIAEYHTTRVSKDYKSFDPITWVEAISVDYGQRHKKETEYAKLTCMIQGIAHTTLRLPDALSSAGTMLTDASVKIPDVSYDDLPHGVSPTYVPFRNGTLLSLITAHAQKWINDNPIGREAAIYFGAHSEDAANWAYPDCTPEFIGAMANAIYIGSYMKIRLYTPLQWLMKDEIVTLGSQLKVDFGDTWSCYAGERIHCGTCPTCRSRRGAFVKASIYDPTHYASETDDGA